MGRPPQGSSCASVSIRLRNISSSSGEWKRVTCPEATCSARPSQTSETSGGWARNCTTKARLLGSVGWDLDMCTVHTPTCVCVGHLRDLPVTGTECRMGSPFKYMASVSKCGAVLALPCPNVIQMWSRASPAVSKVIRGARQIVLVRGDMGTGKTTVIDLWLARLATDSAVRIGRGQCLERDIDIHGENSASPRPAVGAAARCVDRRCR
jgi:hypothetical protein